MYEKGMRLLFKIVSMRDVAVMMCEEPAVSDVKRYSAGSSSHTLSSAMFPSGLDSTRGWRCVCGDWNVLGRGVWKGEGRTSQGGVEEGSSCCLRL
jgi:hypothetical protein